jgi:hypothetical protein
LGWDIRAEHWTCAFDQHRLHRSGRTDVESRTMIERPS